MKTELLSDWEIGLLRELVSQAKKAPFEYDDAGVEELDHKLRTASHIRLSYRSVPRVMAEWQTVPLGPVCVK